MRKWNKILRLTFLLVLLLEACSSQTTKVESNNILQDETSPELTVENSIPGSERTERPIYSPGELVDYLAQTGDTLPALAAHFNTTIDEIHQANSFIPQSVTTLPPGMPMKIPIYYVPLWGSSYQILHDSLYVNGPAQIGFSTQGFIEQHAGWLKNYFEYASGRIRSGAEIIDLVARNYSISPKVLLTLLEYHAGVFHQNKFPSDLLNDFWAIEDQQRTGFYLQLVWVANILNNGYYGWRTGRLTVLDHRDGWIEHPDPWQNSASVALQFLFAQIYNRKAYDLAIGSSGFSQTYQQLFGDPLPDLTPHIPGSLEQPSLFLPFTLGETWYYTGGPHTGWGEGDPFAALDFAPGAETAGCIPTTEWATALAGGIVTNSEPGMVWLDLDGDGDQRTGWVIFYFHIGTEGRVNVGKVLQARDPVGHPSCEGGRSTGTHIHIARLYNGEWIPAEGPLAFNMEGWIAHNGKQPYLGTLTRHSQIVISCACGDEGSSIEAGRE